MLLKKYFVFLLFISIFFFQPSILEALQCGKFIDLAPTGNSGEYAGFDFIRGVLFFIQTDNWDYEIAGEKFDKSIHGLVYDEERERIY